jgi:hypothetical protein
MANKKLDDIDVGNLIEIIYDGLPVQHLFAVKKQFNYSIIEVVAGNHFKKDYEYANNNLNARSDVIDHGRWDKYGQE